MGGRDNHGFSIYAATIIIFLQLIFAGVILILL